VRTLGSLSRWASVVSTGDSSPATFLRKRPKEGHRNFVIPRGGWVAEDSAMRLAVISLAIVVVFEYILFTWVLMAWSSLPATPAEIHARQEFSVFTDTSKPVAERIKGLDSYVNWALGEEGQYRRLSTAYYLDYLSHEVNDLQPIRDAAAAAKEKLHPGPLPW